MIKNCTAPIGSAVFNKSTVNTVNFAVVINRSTSPAAGIFNKSAIGNLRNIPGIIKSTPVFVFITYKSRTFDAHLTRIINYRMRTVVIIENCINDICRSFVKHSPQRNCASPFLACHVPGKTIETLVRNRIFRPAVNIDKFNKISRNRLFFCNPIAIPDIFQCQLFPFSYIKNAFAAIIGNSIALAVNNDICSDKLVYPVSFRNADILIKSNTFVSARQRRGKLRTAANLCRPRRTYRQTSHNH